MQHVIVRTAWLYGTAGPSFVHTMLRLLNERESLEVVDDQIGAPTYTADLAEALLAFIEKDGAANGLYHYSNEGRISWYDFSLCGKIPFAVFLRNILSEPVLWHKYVPYDEIGCWIKKTIPVYFSTGAADEFQAERP